jgi:hypothetical protein
VSWWVCFRRDNGDRFERWTEPSWYFDHDTNNQEKADICHIRQGLTTLSDYRLVSKRLWTQINDGFDCVRQSTAK